MSKSKVIRWAAITTSIFMLLTLPSMTVASSSDEPQFKGKIAVGVEESVPAWPDFPTPPPNAPNIVIILWDDIGFADASTFGGVAETPELDKLAAQGLRYTNFNVAGMCSPTRAALLTGRNHHRVGFGVAEIAGGFPGYDSVWKRSNVSVAEVLRRMGYSTAMFGKWHNTPHWEISPIGPFDRWPTSLGFEHFYGFMAGMENQWQPSRLYRNTIAIEAPYISNKAYHLTTDIANEAINWIHTHESLAPSRPYFLYFSTGATHAPHHVPREWIDRYKGQFDRGWDALRTEVFARQKRLGVIPRDTHLTPRPKEIPAWSTLSNQQKALYARQMEVYAGFVSHTDYETGRVLRAVQENAQSQNTLVLHIVGDNGAATGGQDGAADGASTVADQITHLDDLGSSRIALNWHAAGWAWLASTPFQGWKGDASHLGGIRNPLVASWPSRIKDRGHIRNQFVHVTDIAPTVYDVTNIDFPATIDGVEQQPLDGITFAQTFDSADAPSLHHLQYFEMLGNRAIYQDGWIASARHFNEFLTSSPSFNFSDDRWELYHVERDFSQARDLATRFPGKLAELQKLFDNEARKNDVYPLGGATAGQNTPSLGGDRSHFEYYPNMPRLSETAYPPVIGKSYRIVAHATIPPAGAEGSIISYGGRESGFSLYIKDGKLFYENNRLNFYHERIASKMDVPRGRVDLTYQFTKEGQQDGRYALEMLSGGQTWGTGRLYINGQLVGEARMSGATLVSRAGPGSLGVGRAFGSPVSDAFQPPFSFTGALEKVIVEIDHEEGTE